MDTTANLGLSRINTPTTDTVDNYRLSINDHANKVEALYSPIPQRTVLEVGLVGQSKAGRQLANADFTDCGAAVPAALWNLSGLTDASGNGFALTNKGAVPFGAGVEGAASTAAVFAGSTAQALYRVDAVDALRIRTGSVGCWMKTAKKGAAQCGVSKWATTGNLRSYMLRIESVNLVTWWVSTDGTNFYGATSVTDVTDDRWHFIVGTYDGMTARIYVDGVLENSLAVPSAIFTGAAPTNIGGYGADAGTAANSPSYGRVDEGFVTGEVLTVDQIRHLYGCKFAHASSAPRRVELRVTRNRKGAALVNGDFPSTPARCYNMAAGALTDLNGGGVLSPGAGSVTTVAGPNGQKDSAGWLGGTSYLQATDVGLPAALTSRSYGLWFATSSVANQNFMGWASDGARLIISSSVIQASSAADAISGPFVSDGLWHNAIVVEDNTLAEGKRKLYLDGALVGTSNVMNSITGAGATGMRVGANSAGGSTLQGFFSRAFVFAGALTWEQVQAVYLKSAPLLAASPKDAADNVEMLGASSVVFNAADLEPQWFVDLEVAR